jgi:hypothetical protein
LSAVDFIAAAGKAAILPWSASPPDIGHAAAIGGKSRPVAGHETAHFLVDRVSANHDYLVKSGVAPDFHAKGM